MYKWIRLKIDETPNLMICLRYGGKATSPIPCGLEDAGEIFKAFLKIHKKCKKVV